MLLFDKFFGMQAEEWRIMLMDALHRHAIGRRASRLGNGRPPSNVSLVQDSRPIDGANDDRLSRAQKHKADGFEFIGAIDRRLDPATAQRMSHGRRDVETKG